LWTMILIAIFVMGKAKLAREPKAGCVQSRVTDNVTFSPGIVTSLGLA
jgi:hypothetical protein